ncbi:hypothetical protein H0H93_006190, partial [Arthromyces matolae]
MYVCETLQVRKSSYVFVRSAVAPSPASSEQNELPPIEMPCSPGLWTPRYHGVGRVPLQVLGWTVE